MADRLRKSGVPVVITANKADNLTLGQGVSEFWEYGFGEPKPVSALHGRGTGDLLDFLTAGFGDLTEADKPDETIPAVALVGRPNVGKSTLLNALAGDARAITSARPHTTRDVTRLAVTTPAGPLTVLDTAGVRRRKISGKGIPKFSLLRTIRAINDADVVALLIDATEDPTLGDAHISAYALEAGKGLVLVVNKWDAVEKGPDVQEQFFASLEKRLGFLPSPPVVFLSAKTGEKLERLGRAAYDVHALASTRIDTAQLNAFLQSQLGRLPGSTRQGAPRLFYATQTDIKPPTFLLFVNKPSLWSDNHRRFLMNALRDEYGLLGTAIRLQFRARRKDTVHA